jgi:hypothetical protein
MDSESEYVIQLNYISRCFASRSPTQSHSYVSFLPHLSQEIDNISPEYVLCTGVADPGCLSRILSLIHPGYRIQQQQQKKGGGLDVLSFSGLAANINEFKIILFLNRYRNSL